MKEGPATSSIAGPVGDPENNTGGRRTATPEHYPGPKGRPARACWANRNGFVRAHVVFVKKHYAVVSP